MAVLILYLIMCVRFILCLLSDFKKIRFEFRVNLIYVVELFQIVISKLASLENKLHFLKKDIYFLEYLTC